MVATDLFYTTEVTLTNKTGAALSNVYYYRNVDADNNVFLNTFYETTNTIDAQPTGGCPKALVSATQPIISGVQASYLGLAAIGPMFRVCTGGFTNRDGSDIWNGIGFNSAVGSSLYIDEAISLGYKITSLASGASETFKFATILAATQIDEAFSNLYELSNLFIKFKSINILDILYPFCSFIDEFDIRFILFLIRNLISFISIHSLHIFIYVSLLVSPSRKISI